MSSTAALAVLSAVVTGPFLGAPSTEVVPVEATEKVEVHAVCVYEGEKETGFADVYVDRPGKTVVLFVGAYETAAWSVTASPGTKLQRVVASGYEPQEVAVPEGVTIVEAWRGKQKPYPGYVIKPDRRLPPFQAFVSRVTTFVRTDRLASFQSSYRPPVADRFVVDDVEKDDRLSAAYPFVSSREDVPEAARELSVVTELFETSEQPRGRSVSMVEMSLFGPKLDTKTSLPERVGRVVEGAGTTYGIAGHDVVEIDLDGRTTTSLLGEATKLAEISWPSDLAFDTKRNRLVVHSSSRKGLYAFDVAQKTWSPLAQKVGTNQLAYSAEEDCLYGIEVPHKGAPRLKQMDEKGREIRTIDLDGPIVSAPLGNMPGVSSTRVESVGKYLVVVTSSSSRLLPTSESPERRIHLVDPSTGQSWLTWRSTTLGDEAKAP